MRRYSAAVPVALLGDNGLCRSPGWLTVYHVHPVTREYLSASEEYLPEGVGLPADSYADKPVPPQNGQTILRTADGTWNSVPDYRGQTAWDINSRRAVTITSAGDPGDHLTFQEPASAFDVWDGQRWIKDHAAERTAARQAAQEERARRLDAAEKRITLLERARRLNMAEPGETAALKAWETYSVRLDRTDLSTAPDISWPDPPQSDDR